ncbi:phosphotransferase enzyme family protein [Pedobacter rhodius]|uniref:Aminoglycoside phosphotransferase family protein n=1 Tax=Pedobacter rhodius TaxID=3004098 RepID=A0ABT4KU48_9SPHI|nr:aminoglycoside phosphotransferase family protein [Pedobacter sp. SJ11]MCZ4222450.1 aminoglycoside phosphotransferase family protein [Pedobacter sp. SJ11]
MIEKVLKAYGLDDIKCDVKPFGNGLINKTWKVSSSDAQYILQKVNTKVFRFPERIAENTLMLKNYLDSVAPQYLFIAPLRTITGDVILEDGESVYRLFPFIADSYTIDTVTEADQAYHAAKQFGKFSRVLEAFNPDGLNVTIPDFHNLTLRTAQFFEALKNASQQRLKTADWAIDVVKKCLWIAKRFDELIAGNGLKTRVIHHDTKINNVLLNINNGFGIGVIDLDTVMPGYFISDVGDMMRTYLSPVNEEETSFDKITVRSDIFLAIYKGYMEEMHRSLTNTEKGLFIYSGQFMIYMQALRFLTDYLNGDIYYPVAHAEHNLMRAKNQLVLLMEYTKSSANFEKIIKNYELSATLTLPKGEGAAF